MFDEPCNPFRSGLPADEFDVLNAMYDSQTELSDLELNELAEAESRRRSTANVIAVGNCAAVDAIIRLFDPNHRPAA